MMGHTQHLHDDDYPNTLRLLRVLVGERADRDALGYTPTSHGAYVDWDRLVDGPLSTTEVAAAYVARGFAVLERHGGTSPRVAEVLVAVARAVAR